MSIQGSGSKPLNIASAELLNYQGLENNERISSNGRFKGLKTSPLDKVKKHLMPSAHKMDEAKRAQQKNISERRINNLTSNSAPKSQDIAHRLDSADYSLESKTGSLSSPLTITLSLEEDPVLNALEKISQLDVAGDKSQSGTNKSASGKAKKAITEQGIKTRTQADCTVFLTNTIRQARCPKSLCHLEGALTTAANKGLISKEQHKQLQQELDAQTLRHIAAFTEKNDYLKGVGSEEKREMIKQQLLELKELVVTVRVVNRDLFRLKTEKPNQDVRSLLNREAVKLQQKSASLAESASTLKETEKRLQSSYKLLKTHVRPVFEQSLLPTKESDKILSDLVKATSNAQKKEETQFNRLISVRNTIHKLEENIRSINAKIEKCSNSIDDTKNNYEAAKKLKEQLNTRNPVKKIKTKKKLHKLEEKLAKENAELEQLFAVKRNLEFQRNKAESDFQQFHFKDKETFIPSRYNRSGTQLDTHPSKQPQTRVEAQPQDSLNRVKVSY